jgi:hypothetical protein
MEIVRLGFEKNAQTRGKKRMKGPIFTSDMVDDEEDYEELYQKLKDVRREVGVVNYFLMFRLLLLVPNLSLHFKYFRMQLSKKWLTKNLQLLLHSKG